MKKTTGDFTIDVLLYPVLGEFNEDIMMIIYYFDILRMVRMNCSKGRKNWDNAETDTSWIFKNYKANCK